MTKFRVHLERHVARGSETWTQETTVIVKAGSELEAKNLASCKAAQISWPKLGEYSGVTYPIAVRAERIDAADDTHEGHHMTHPHPLWPYSAMCQVPTHFASRTVTRDEAIEAVRHAMEYGRLDLPLVQRGCICPPGSNRDCENPLCPRKAPKT